MTGTDTEIVEGADGYAVRQPYRGACRDYTLGFALVAFMMGAVLTFPLAFELDVPMLATGTVVHLIWVLAMLGYGFLVVAYSFPIRFYELLEGEPDG